MAKREQGHSAAHAAPSANNAGTISAYSETSAYYTPSKATGHAAYRGASDTSAVAASPSASGTATGASSAVRPATAHVASSEQNAAFAGMPTSASAYSRNAYGSAGRAAGGSASGPNKKPPSKLWKVVFIVSLVVLIGALAVLGFIVYQYWAQQQAYDSLEQYANISEEEGVALSDLTVDWDALYAINPDIVAWVYVPGTKINYPVVQGEDNEEYLHTAFDGTSGALSSAGTIFLDYANASDFSDQNSVLYGHHMRDGSMFAAIDDWTNDDDFNEHRDIYVLTPQGNYRLKSIALVLTTGSDTIVETSFSSILTFQDYVQDKLDRSVVSQSGDVIEADDVSKLMMFSTCEYTQNDGRCVLFASVVETTVEEDPYITNFTEGKTGLTDEEQEALEEETKEAA